MRVRPAIRLLFILVLALSGMLVSADTTDEEVWQRFLKWLPSAPVSDSPLTLLQAYRDNLMGSGTSAVEADRHVEAIKKLMRVRQDGWRVIFNNIYASREGGFSTQPSAVLVSAVEGRTPGRALDAGMGQGRNAIFLALKGWDVTGFDVSDTGIALARSHAQKAGVRINGIQASESTFDYGAAQWDLMVFTYVPFRVDDPAYVARLARALRPGGLVVVESFASDAASSGRRPVDIDPAALRRAFDGFRIARLDDLIDTPEWTTGRSRIVRFVAEKPR